MKWTDLLISNQVEHQIWCLAQSVYIVLILWAFLLGAILKYAVIICFYLRYPYLLLWNEKHKYHTVGRVPNWKYKQCMLQCKVLTFYLWCHLDIRVCMLLICGNHMQDRIISLRGEVGVHKTRLAPPLFMVQDFASGQSCRDS
jgi:hypothetical protein